MRTKPTFIPDWIRHLSEGTDSQLDQLHILGFWDMEDGDWYANGQWNPKPWEMWEKSGAKLGIEPRFSMMPFARAMKRAYDLSPESERQALVKGMVEMLGIIEDLARQAAGHGVTAT